MSRLKGPKSRERHHQQQSITEWSSCVLQPCYQTWATCTYQPRSFLGVKRMRLPGVLGNIYTTRSTQSGRYLSKIVPCGCFAIPYISRFWTNPGRYICVKWGYFLQAKFTSIHYFRNRTADIWNCTLGFTYWQVAALWSGRITTDKIRWDIYQLSRLYIV